MPVNKQGSFYVHAELVKHDRGRRSQEQVAIDPDNQVTLSTLKRAEAGGPISFQSISYIAKAFGRDPEEYIIGIGADAYRKAYKDVSGTWQVFYVEDDIGEDAYICNELVTVHQRQSNIRGEYTCLTYERKANFLFEGIVKDSMVKGSYEVPGREETVGIGLFHLILSRGDEWMEGYCTWHDYDTKKIECSKNIWIKEGSQYFDTLMRQAEDIMKFELDVFSGRRAKWG